MTPRLGSYLDEARCCDQVRTSTSGCCFLGITSSTVWFCFLAITSSTAGFYFLASHRTRSATPTTPPTSSLFHLDEVW
jgi:hypothetical protein